MNSQQIFSKTHGIDKIGIGTAQFGLNYGISNTQGKTSLTEAKDILELASLKGIKLIDTAPAYGDSEKIIGNILPLNCHFDIVIKTPHFPNKTITNEDVLYLRNTFKQSLLNLKQSSAYGILIHNVNDLMKPNGDLLINNLIDLRRQGLVKKIGVSVYTSEQIDEVLQKNFIDIIQIPLNIFDQRLLEKGCLSKLKRQQIEIHVRSIFLQGLLLMNIDSLPPFFTSIKENFQKYEQFIKDHQINKIDAAIHFIKNIQEIDKLIFGVNNLRQFKEILAAYESNYPLIELSKYYELAIHQTEILEPFRWQQQ
ncbi:MAG: aldo/keto reductase [Cyanobacteria bacterium]|nr:aldo/keto reductase [Cyanobacteriota bacterium]